MLSKKRVASFQCRTLITMSAEILAMQEQWENRDQELLNQMEKLQSSVHKDIKKLESKWPKLTTSEHREKKGSKKRLKHRVRN